MSDLTSSVAARRAAARSWLRRALWPLTVAAGLAAESVLWRSGAPPAYVVFDLAVGFTVVAVSFAVWESHPGNRIGPLLFVNSAWFLISPVRYIASPFWISLAWVAQLASSAVFAQSSRCESYGRRERHSPSGLPAVLHRSCRRRGSARSAGAWPLVVPASSSRFVNSPRRVTVARLAAIGSR